jgi:hypothetical protein
LLTKGISIIHICTELPNKEHEPLESKVFRVSLKQVDSR